jgi:hypothetical protein
VGQGQKDITGAVAFVGEKGTIRVDRSKISSTPAEILEAPDSRDNIQLYKSANHHANFLECIKSRELPICDVEIGHRSATVCHLGNIVARLGRGIQWDPVKETIVGDPEAATMLSRPYRQPWALV